METTNFFNHAALDMSDLQVTIRKGAESNLDSIGYAQQ